MSITAERAVVGPWQVVDGVGVRHGRRTRSVEWVGGPWDKTRVRVQDGQTSLTVRCGDVSWALPIQHGKNRGAHIVWEQPAVDDFVTARIKTLMHANYYSWMTYADWIARDNARVLSWALSGERAYTAWRI